MCRKYVDLEAPYFHVFETQNLWEEEEEEAVPILEKGLPSERRL